ncbi:MAG: hypothetical protein PWP07_2061 [Epulopiscium sp.]|uniref:Uncharacterized protein n=1 Tax=Defluviitalea raffinosedens TaxID=1450156 RepID=A0A7C8HDM2_9FIRM|nr:DUF6106 family protein [Defluviitalea raffinosedens]MBZ4668324.1 uncharacterized protein [Defluviitaleaceae bacterium]MDK2788816.1 hypothetical protein [Candidatus Epulonipiscium sp.]KAE9631374.1 hypothetical protein GND95_11470 [Defluviitalea raffinosedens]MBM7684856.1 hypothetical protein [Defluviitalea raffinosedens]HHW67091.1 hypothetical protein [Candidatus Epulonipiscium sp.]
MGDIFKEQLVSKKRTAKDGMITALVILAAILLVAASFLFIPQAFVLVVIIVAYGAYWLVQRQNIEYEYSFTNGDLDIDKIINKSKRKRLISVSVKDFEAMAHVEDKDHSHELSGFEKTLDFSSGEIKSNTYAAVFMHNNQKVKMIFEPNEEILKGIFHLIPRKLHIKK